MTNYVSQTAKDIKNIFYQSLLSLRIFFLSLLPAIVFSTVSYISAVGFVYGTSLAIANFFVNDLYLYNNEFIPIDPELINNTFLTQSPTQNTHRDGFLAGIMLMVASPILAKLSQKAERFFLQDVTRIIDSGHPKKTIRTPLSLKAQDSSKLLKTKGTPKTQSHDTPSTEKTPKSKGKVANCA